MFALMIFLLLLLLARQADLIPPGPAGRVVRATFHPIVAAVAAMDRFVEQGWVIVFRSRDLEAENRELRKEIAELRVHYQQLADAHARLERLSQLTASQPTSNRPNVTANIIGFSPNLWSRTVTIDCGRSDGVTTGMPVVNRDGLVGFVRDVSEGDALVQLLVDSEFAAGARVFETRDRGIIVGTGEMDRLLLILDNPQTQVQAGYKVITSGQPAGSLFRQGLVIGNIEGVQQNKFGQPYAVVRPTVRFDRLEEVVVLVESRRNEPSPQNLPVPPP
jgi:rod shape-determining protein MreC